MGKEAGHTGGGALQSIVSPWRMAGVWGGAALFALFEATLHFLILSLSYLLQG